MLPTKNYKHTFKFVKVINRNTFNVFHFGYNKKDIFDEIMITSALRQYKNILTIYLSE